MAWETIKKTERPSWPAPNLADYAATRAEFSWEQARAALRGLPGGGLNIAFEASAGVPVLSALVLRGKNRRGPPWELVWHDEFDGHDLDDTKWNIDVWPPRKVNEEDQAYTARVKNLRLDDGLLVIEAHKEDHEEAEYTSGRVHSSGKGDFLYGRFEVRAKLPRGQGTWPAIWMLPSDPFAYATQCEEGDWQGNPDCDAWPNSGEIDIMEHVGYQMNHVHGTVHTKAYYWQVWEQRTEIRAALSPVVAEEKRKARESAGYLSKYLA